MRFGILVLFALALLSGCCSATFGQLPDLPDIKKQASVMAENGPMESKPITNRSYSSTLPDVDDGLPDLSNRVDENTRRVNQNAQDIATTAAEVEVLSVRVDELESAPVAYQARQSSPARQSRSTYSPPISQMGSGQAIVTSSPVVTYGNPVVTYESPSVSFMQPTPFLSAPAPIYSSPVSVTSPPIAVASPMPTPIVSRSTYSPIVMSTATVRSQPVRSFKTTTVQTTCTGPNCQARGSLGTQPRRGFLNLRLFNR